MAIGNNINQLYQYTDSQGKKYSINPAASGGYMKAYEQYAADREAQQNATQAALQKTLEQNNATTNANYDNSARQAYVDYMRKQRALPGQLQALGVRGGATESGLLNLYNNYGVAHAANEQQRNADLTSNQNAYDDAYNSAYQNYLADLNEQKQTAINNQINEYNNEITRFSSSVAQYPSTSAGYKAYQQWISNLEASSDPLKDIKVALVRQQMASQFPNGSPSGGGSGGGSRRSGGSGGYTTGNGNDNANGASEGILTRIAREALGSYNNGSAKSSSSSKIASAIKKGAKATNSSSKKTSYIAKAYQRGLDETYHRYGKK